MVVRKPDGGSAGQTLDHRLRERLGAERLQASEDADIALLRRTDEAELMPGLTLAEAPPGPEDAGTGIMKPTSSPTEHSTIPNRRAPPRR